jgi:hypothetical protein
MKSTRSGLGASGKKGAMRMTRRKTSNRWRSQVQVHGKYLTGH